MADEAPEATAAAQAHAEELGVDLSQVEGSGADGKITKADVAAHAVASSDEAPGEAEYSAEEHENLLKYIDMMHHETREQTIARLKDALKG